MIIQESLLDSVKLLVAGCVKIRAANDSSVFTIREKALARACSWWKVPNIAKQALIHGK